MSLRPEPSDRLTAFGNQLVDVHLYLREELARLRADVAGHLASGGERPRELRAPTLARHEERKPVAALNALDGSAGTLHAGFEDFALRDLTQP
ncbi:hypothetical protein AB4225_13705 [Streptomyces sp. 2RAF24]|uniref:hypothetical protein n=1 Tax=Streptomyces sp. 2RAF24 TaxID=3232997 RepID=UPI003F99A663